MPNVQIIYNIIILASIYLLVAQSFFFYYFPTKTFNLSIAASIAIAPYFFHLLQNQFEFNLFTSVLLSIGLTIVISTLSEILIFKALRKRNTESYSLMIASIGLYTILQNILSVYFGDSIKSISNIETKIGNNFLGGYITDLQLVTILTSILISVVMMILFNKTILGLKIKAVSENAELSKIYGLNSEKVILVCTVISTILAAFTGYFYAFENCLTPTMGFNLLFYGIVIMIIGGNSSFKGLIFGSLLLSTIQTLVSYYISNQILDSITFFILIIFLIWKPLGIAGKQLKKVEL